MNEKKNHFIMKNKNFYGTEPKKGYCPSELKAGLGAGRAGAGRAGAGRAGTAQAAWARRRGAHGRWGGRRWGAQGALGAAGMGARSAGELACGAERHGMDAQGRAAGAGRGARGGLCAPGVRSWARLGVLLHLTQFLVWFDLVFFPSHQMNTVHCEIKFFEKKNI